MAFFDFVATIVGKRNCSPFHARNEAFAPLVEAVVWPNQLPI